MSSLGVPAHQRMNLKISSVTLSCLPGTVLPSKCNVDLLAEIANGVLWFVFPRKHGVGKLIMSSSPSTRFDGSDIDGLKEDDLVIPKTFLQVMCMSVEVLQLHGGANVNWSMLVLSSVSSYLGAWSMIYNRRSLFPALRRKQGDGRKGGVGSVLGQPAYGRDSAASDIWAKVRRVSHRSSIVRYLPCALQLDNSSLC